MNWAVQFCTTLNRAMCSYLMWNGFNGHNVNIKNEIYVVVVEGSNIDAWLELL